MNLPGLNTGRGWRTLLVAALATVLCQCSNKEGKEKDFVVRMDTKNPLIHEVKRKIGTTEIQPNWFNFSFKVTNNTDQWVKIEDILLTYSVNGTEQAPISFDLSLVQKTDSEGNTFNYANFCMYPPDPASEKQFSACLIEATSINDPGAEGVSDVAPHVQGLSMYIGGLQKLGTESRVYLMRVELLGVFMENLGPSNPPGNETDRFTKRFNFTTR